MTRATWETLSSTLLVVVALGMAGSHVHDRLSAESERSDTRIEKWQEHNRSGLMLHGQTTSPVIITEFMDFTCPYCARLVPVIDSLVQMYPNQIAVVFQHFPLQGRELSLPSAIAAECAAEQGQFREMFYALYTNADSIGVWDWTRFAEQARIPDLVAYGECLARPADSFKRIADGRAIGEQTGTLGTPTVWINGEVVGGRTVPQLLRFAEERGLELRTARQH